MGNRNIVNLAVAALCLLLAGCFTSSTPKFSLVTAVPALGEGGRYIGYERLSDGSFRNGEVFSVRHRADGTYDFTDAAGKTTSLSLHRIGSELYVAQATEREPVHTDYVVLRIVGREVTSYGLTCDRQDLAKLKAAGVVVRNHECNIDGVADPAALFASLDLGEPTSKMIRQ